MTHKERKFQKQLEHYKVPLVSKDEEKKLYEVLQNEINSRFFIPEKHLIGGILNQAGYISPFTWLFQILILAAGGLLAAGERQETVLQNVALIIPLISLTGIPELAKSYHCGMWELEESCFYNLRQVILMKMVIFGVTDGVILCILAGVARSGGTGFYEALLSILIPYNLSCTIYLELFRMRKRQCSSYLLATAALIMVLALSAAKQVPLPRIAETADVAVKIGAVLLGVLSLLLLAGSAGHLLNNIKKEEQVLWNYGQTG